MKTRKFSVNKYASTLSRIALKLQLFLMRFYEYIFNVFDTKWRSSKRVDPE